MVPKVEEGRMNCKQLPVKGGVMALSWGKFGGVEGKGEPVAMMPLLKDSTNVGVRGIRGVRGVSGETDGGSGIRMREEGSLGKGRFGSLERCGHRGSPVEGAASTSKGISEGLEKTGDVRKETVVEVNRTEEALKVLNSLWLGIVENGVYIGGKGSDASGGDLVAKEGNRRLGKGAF